MNLISGMKARVGRRSRVTGVSAMAAMAFFASAVLSSPARAASCTINSTAAAFGNYDGTLNDIATATISGTCTRGGPPDPDLLSTTVSLSTGVSGTYAPRQMANGANRLNYNLYTDAARSIVWGNGTAGTSTVSALALQSNGSFLNPNASRGYSLTAYGRIPAGLSVPSGSYSDTITVTITF